MRRIFGSGFLYKDVLILLRTWMCKQQCSRDSFYSMLQLANQLRSVYALKINVQLSVRAFRRCRHIGINFIQWHRAAIFLYDPAMESLEPARLWYTTGVRNNADFLMHVLRVLMHALRLVFHHQSTLQPFIMCGDSGRAGIFVALHCLNAAEGKHKTARGLNEIGTYA